MIQPMEEPRKLSLPDLELVSASGASLNPSSFAGHELIVLFCPTDAVAAGRELEDYHRHGADLVKRDAWLIAFSDSLPTVDGSSHGMSLIPDSDRRAWTTFRDLTDDPEGLDRNSGATFYFTRGGTLHRVWNGTGNVQEVLTELSRPSVESGGR